MSTIKRDVQTVAEFLVDHLIDASSYESAHYRPNRKFTLGEVRDSRSVDLVGPSREFNENSLPALLLVCQQIHIEGKANFDACEMVRVATEVQQ